MKVLKPTPKSLTRLSDDTIQIIFSFLPFKTLIKIELVCKRFKYLLTRNSNGISTYDLTLRERTTEKGVKKYLDQLGQVKLSKICCLFPRNHHICFFCEDDICAETEEFIKQDDDFACGDCISSCGDCGTHHFSDNEFVKCWCCGIDKCLKCTHVCPSCDNKTCDACMVFNAQMNTMICQLCDENDSD